MDAFEKHLSQMKHQSPPDNLRERCLAGLKLGADQNSHEARSTGTCLEGFWTRWLWPHPKAWAGLACVWFVCF